MCAGAIAEVHAALAAAKAAALAARAPFQWVDGPLVTAMRQGDIILIDELNLAEDAVLERMNRCSSRFQQAHTTESAAMRIPEPFPDSGLLLVAPLLEMHHGSATRLT